MSITLSLRAAHCLFRSILVSTACNIVKKNDTIVKMAKKRMILSVEFITLCILDFIRDFCRML